MVEEKKHELTWNRTVIHWTAGLALHLMQLGSWLRH